MGPNYTVKQRTIGSTADSYSYYFKDYNYAVTFLCSVVTRFNENYNQTNHSVIELYEGEEPAPLIRWEKNKRCGGYTKLA